MACRSGCPVPGTHSSWGECARAARIQIDRHGLQHRSLEKAKDRRLSRYEDAVRQGLEPRSTTWRDINDAFENGGAEKPLVTAQDMAPAVAAATPKED